MNKNSSTAAPHAASFRFDHRWLPRIALLAGLALAGWMAAHQFALPSVRPATAPATEFSAQRAMPHLEVIAAAPRPVSAPGHVRTRAYLLEEIRRLDLEPEVQETSTVLRFEGSPGFSAGRIRNVLVRLPGTASTGAIALDAHYDGAATGPAAGDCGSGVITLLETLRALRSGPPLRNDVIFVFADAEEVGDLGAHAFTTGHPWMDDVRLALNYESMGTGGPAYLYATSAHNHALIDAYATAAPGALSNSFVVGLFNLLPEQRLACDLQDYLNAGSAGYGFVFTGDTYAYHTVLDDMENLDPRTVQQLGDNTLALVRYFGEADLGDLQGKTESIFFSIWPGVLLHYSVGWALPLAALGFTLLLIVLAFGLRRNGTKVGKVVLATLTYLLGLLLALLIAAAAWYVLKALLPDLQVMQIGNRATGWLLAGLLLLAGASMTAVAVWVSPRLSGAYQFAGALTGFALLGLLFAFIYPIGTHLFLWPLLAGLPALWWLLDRQGSFSPWGKASVLLVAAIPPVLLIAPVMAGPNPFLGLLIRLDALTGMPLLAVDALFAALLTGFLAPLAGSLFSPASSSSARRWWAPAVGLALALLASGVGWSRLGFDAAYPRPESIRYELDADEETARWVTDDPQPGVWTRQFLDPEFRKPAPEGASLLMGWPSTFSGPAPFVSIPPPTVEMIRDRVVNGDRLLQLRLRTLRSAPTLQVRVEAKAALRSAAIAGEPLDLADYPRAADGVLIFNYVACPPEGIELSLQIAGPGSVQVILADMTDGLPEIPGRALPSRPVTTMPALTSTDAVVVRSVVVLPRANP